MNSLSGSAIPTPPPLPGNTISGGNVIISPKRVSEVIAYEFNFISSLAPTEVIQSVTASISVYAGADPAAATMIYGPASIAGSIVTQGIAYGVAGVMYFVKILAKTSFNQTLEITGYLAVEPDAP